MEPQAIQDYLQRNLGLETSVEPLVLQDMPNFVRRQFQLFRMMLFGHSVGVLISRRENFSDHDFLELLSAVALLRDKGGCLPMLVFPKVSKQERLALIRQKISFLVPSSQMFLPYLGIELSDRIPKVAVEHRHLLRPSAQAMFIQHLLEGNLQQLTVNQAAKALRLTAMGALRAANQLDALGLCKVHFNGFSKTLDFQADRQKLWQAAQPLLQSPVRKRLTVEDDRVLTGFPFSGEYALSLHTNLTSGRKCYALPQTAASTLLKEGKIIQAYPPETGLAEVEVWSYTLPSWNQEVDSLSLTLSLRDKTEPRVKLAVMQLEEQLQW